MKKTYCFDIDGVVCTNTDGDYAIAMPIPQRIEVINHLHRDHKIIFFTARGTVTGIDWREVTEKQFKEWGLEYDEIIFGKPHFDLFVDDKAVNDKFFFQDGK